MFFAEHDPTSKGSFFIASSTTSAVTRLRNQGQSAEALAEREGGPVSEHWEAAVERARRVLAESEEERAAVEARMVEAFEATGRDRKILFDSNGYQIAGPMPSCSHQNVKP
jgi:hypothetical protein